MSFLAPWFVLAGLVAVGLPVLFHLFRRTPRGRLPFSTLMFLTPSPPRLTSRNRLENWPLLLMRALVFVLLAFAFGRPFLRQLLEEQATTPVGKRVVILVDTSASMRRSDLWSQAKQAIEERLTTLSPHDELALLTFDSQVRTLLSLEAWRKAPISERVGLARGTLAELTPSWFATRLDDGLLAAVEVLEAAEKDAASKGIEREQRIVLISDLQSGSHITGLQGLEWPRRVPVEWVAVTTKKVNAGVHPLETTVEAAKETTAAAKLRVLVTNAPGSTRENFELAWKTTAAEPPPALSVYVPPGQTRVTSTPVVPDGAVAQLVLRGDDEDFDNHLWFVPTVREQVRVLHLSREAPDDPQSLRYFLERALSLPTAGRIISVDALDPHGENVRPPIARDLENVPLVVLADERELPEAWQVALDKWVDQGGIMLAVVTSPQAKGWRSFLPREAMDAAEVSVADHDPQREYSLFGEIDMHHPLFEPLNDPRFSDFTKIRIWRHRRLTLSSAASDALRPLAKFDSGEPALLEAKRGSGRVLFLAMGWQPRESQLGVSSKFVPLLATLVDLGWRRPPPSASYEAGQTLDLAHLGRSDAAETSTADEPATRATGPWKITTPTGEIQNVAADQPQFLPTAGPGVYEIESPAGLQRVAINVPADESKTDPLGAEALERLGVRLWKKTADASPATAAEKQLLQVRELESRQQLWRWCLLLAIGVVIGETWYAGKVARRDELGTIGN